MSLSSLLEGKVEEEEEVMVEEGKEEVETRRIRREERHSMKRRRRRRRIIMMKKRRMRRNGVILLLLISDKVPIRSVVSFPMFLLSPPIHTHSFIPSFFPSCPCLHIHMYRWYSYPAVV